MREDPEGREHPKAPLPMQCNPLVPIAGYTPDDDDPRVFLSAIPGRNRRFTGYAVGPGYAAGPAPSSQLEEHEDDPQPEEHEDIPPPPVVEDLPGTSHTGVTEVEPDHPDPGVVQRMSTINKFLDTLEEKVITEMQFLISNGRNIIQTFNDKDKQKILDRIQSGQTKCSDCGKSFYSTTNLKKHFRKKHMDEEIIKCSLCEESFVDKFSCRNHSINKHQVDPANPGKKFTLLTCNQCPPGKKKFSTYHPAQYRTHQLSHEVPENTTCEHCSKTFSHKKGLKEHLTNKTCPVLRRQLEEEAPEDQATGVPKNFEYPQCGKKYVQKKSLQRHQREKGH